mmetsp:Transcript_142921/g.252344  ORF Transcript_142921/g.252344 Transcript_142921/m.252344 type:complete len:387 (+) Transcript_142921:42-1202(+)
MFRFLLSLCLLLGKQSLATHDSEHSRNELQLTSTASHLDDEETHLLDDTAMIQISRSVIPETADTEPDEETLETRAERQRLVGYSIPISALVCIGFLMYLSNSSVQSPPKKMDEGSAKEAEALKSNNFRYTALLSVPVMLVGFLPALFYRLKHGVWVATADFMCQYVVAVLDQTWWKNAHNIIALGWLVGSCWQVGSAVLGSKDANASWRPLHRRIGYASMICGFITISSGSVMTMTKLVHHAHSETPGETKRNVHLLIQGCCMMCNLIPGVTAARRKEFVEHKAFMFLTIAWTCNISLNRAFFWAFSSLCGCSTNSFSGEAIIPAFVIVGTLLWLRRFGNTTRHVVLLNIPGVLCIIGVDISQMITSGVGTECPAVHDFMKRVLR